MHLDSKSLYNFLYEWIHKVLNVGEGLGIEIIRSHDPIPTPNTNNEDLNEDDLVDNEDPNKTPDPYIAIEYTGSLEKFGRGAVPSRIWSYGNMTIMNDFDKIIELREVNGEGDLLRLLIETIYRQDIRDLWRQNYITYRYEGSINPIPVQTDNAYTTESLVEITIGFASGTTYKPGYFSSAQFTGTINRPGGLNNITIQEGN